MRDALLGLPVTERDYVVVGATPEALLSQGYTLVGKDFPVFLHPETHEEYALARTERKVGPGYHGFTCYAAPEVSLTDDLKRRDLTINAIAQSTETQALIDPFNGQADLAAQVLRHISPAFAEDPVRILRLARFAAKLPAFAVAPETVALMKTMVDAGEVAHLTAERVFQECHKALGESAPGRFFEVLKACGALAVLWPEMAADETLLTDFAAHCDALDTPEARWALLTYRLPQAVITRYADHYRLPNTYRALATLVHTHHATYAVLSSLPVEAQLAFYQQTDAMRRRARFEQFCAIAEVIYRAQGNVLPKQLIAKQLEALSQIDYHALSQRGLSGAEFLAARRTAECHALRAAQAAWAHATE